MKHICVSKEAYPTREIAQRVLQKREREGVRLSIYECEEVGEKHYHLTSKTMTPYEQGKHDALEAVEKIVEKLQVAANLHFHGIENGELYSNALYDILTEIHTLKAQPMKTTKEEEIAYCKKLEEQGLTLMEVAQALRAFRALKAQPINHKTE